MGNTRDRDRSFPANLTMRAGNWIVNKIHCLRNGRPGHLQRTKAGDFHDVKKYSRRAEENRTELKEPTGTPIAGRRQSTWSRLVNEKRPPPPPAKLRRTPGHGGPLPVQLSPRDAAFARAHEAWNSLVNRRQDPKERSISTRRAAFAMAMAGLAALKDHRGDQRCDDYELALIKELILLELPGLDTRQPTSKQEIAEEIARFGERCRQLAEEKDRLVESYARPKLLQNTMQELARCEGCLRALSDALDNYKEVESDPDYWLHALERRWKRECEGDLFQILRNKRDLERISADHAFSFLPQELCLLERLIATHELRDLYYSDILSDDEFSDLVEALARGWPGVREDQASPIPERRANAAGCFRSLAQLANRGRLPREILANFLTYDEINRKLLIRAEGEKLGAEGEKLGAKYAELMQAERKLRAAGIDIRGVRVDERFVHALEKADPELRKRVSLLLAHVALIEDDIEKLDKTFVRHTRISRQTRAQIAALIDERTHEPWANALTRQEVADSIKEHMHATPSYPMSDAEARSPVGQLTEIAIRNRTKGDPIAGRPGLEPEPLLHYGITREDMQDMDLPSVGERGDVRSLRKRDIGTIRKLARMGFSNAKQVKAQIDVMRTVQDGVVNTKAGRTALSSTVGLTTVQLASEFLAKVFRSVSGLYDRVDLAHDDPAVIAGMKREIGKIQLTDDQKRQIREENDLGLESIQRQSAKKEPDKDLLFDLDKAILADAEFIRDEVLVPQHSNFLTALIRAAVLSARPRTIARPGVASAFEPIDTYDASRHRQKIFEILELWGLDTELYRALIDGVVFSRAEASNDAPGTVTAAAIDRWKAEFIPTEELESHVGQAKKNARRKASLKKETAEYFTGKDTSPINPELVDRFLTAIADLGNFDKLSVRTNSIGMGTVPIDAGLGAALSFSGVFGPQKSLIIRRIGDRIEVRMVGGGFGEGAIAASLDLSGIFAKLGIKSSGKFARWMTTGGSLHFEIERDANGREDFSKVQSFVKALLTGKLPNPESWDAFKWQETEKSGYHSKLDANFNGKGGLVLPLGNGLEFSIGAGGSANLGYWRRRRKGIQENAEATKKVKKITNGVVVTTETAVGMSLGVDTAPAASSVSEHPTGGVRSQNLLGASAGFLRYLELGNLAAYEMTDKSGVMVYKELDVFRLIAGARTAEQAFARFEEYGLPFAALLEEKETLEDGTEKVYDRTTVLENGERVSFRKAVEQALGQMRENDGLLLWFTLHQDALANIRRSQRRIYQIRHQVLPVVSDVRERRRLKKEIARLESRIERMKDPSNPRYFVPYGLFVVPVEHRQEAQTVFNGLGLLEVSHVGVSVPDWLTLAVPAPRLDGRHRENVEGFLDQELARKQMMAKQDEWSRAETQEVDSAETHESESGKANNEPKGKERVGPGLWSESELEIIVD